MKYLNEILYGCLVGNFLANTWKKLTSTLYKGRYAIIAEHCNYTDLVVEVGRTDTKQQADAAWAAVDESMFFMCTIYDLLDPLSFDAYRSMNLTPFRSLPVDEQQDLKNGRLLCG